MVYSEEAAIRARVIEALRDAYPDRAAPMSEQVSRWFTRHWRNEPASPIPESERCRLCDLHRRFAVSRAGQPAERGPLPLCADCVHDAAELARDPRFPPRDMVRLEALRALRSAGEEEAAHFVEAIAAAFPDLVRDGGACDLCRTQGPLVRGARVALCASCLARIDRTFEEMRR